MLGWRGVALVVAMLLLRRLPASSQPGARGRETRIGYRGRTSLPSSRLSGSGPWARRRFLRAYGRRRRGTKVLAKIGYYDFEDVVDSDGLRGVSWASY